MFLRLDAGFSCCVFVSGRRLQPAGLSAANFDSGHCCSANRGSGVVCCGSTGGLLIDDHGPANVRVMSPRGSPVNWYAWPYLGNSEQSPVVIQVYLIDIVTAATCAE